MADEITVNLSLVASKSGVQVRRAINDSFDWTTPRTGGQVQTVGTTHEAIVVPADMTTAGWMWFRNLDPTNYAEVGRDSGGSFLAVAKLKPGEPAFFRAASNALYLKANTAPCEVEYGILAD